MFLYLPCNLIVSCLLSFFVHVYLAFMIFINIVHGIEQLCELELAILFSFIAVIYIKENACILFCFVLYIILLLKILCGTKLINTKCNIFYLEPFVDYRVWLCVWLILTWLHVFCNIMDYWTKLLKPLPTRQNIEQLQLDNKDTLQSPKRICPGKL